jgi:hypothetical protein
MVEIVLVLTLFCVAAIALARYAPVGNAAVVFGYAVIFAEPPWPRSRP